MNDQNSGWFLTSTGRQFWPMSPSPDQIHIEDIAHALSHICRFGGHSHTFYSVAQHSLMVCSLVPRELAILGLMHDATEAYCGDMVRPLKQFMPDYKKAEEKIWHAIADKFNLPHFIPAAVHDADNIALVTERRDVMPKASFKWSSSLESYTPDKYTIRPMSPEIARLCFLARFHELYYP